VLLPEDFLWSFNVSSQIFVAEERGSGLGASIRASATGWPSPLGTEKEDNSFASRGLVVIFFYFRVFPARKGCTVLSLFLI